MLKGFVSGEEKDIKRIPMKGHNLLAANGTVTINNVSVTITNGHFLIVGTTNSEISSTNTAWKVLDFTLPAGTYRFKTDALNGVGFYIKIYETGAQLAGRDASFALEAETHCYIAFYIYKNKSGEERDIMLNAGDTPLPYEPYGYQEGWEVRDNQDRILWGREDELQTATGTLPFKGYSLPLKVKSLLGNAVQNGTPAPDNIIMPEMCGVRTGNLADYKYLFSDDYSRTSQYFSYYRINAEPNTTYTCSSNAPFSTEGNQTTFMIGLTDTQSTSENGIFGTKTITTDNTGILYIAIRILGTTSVRVVDITDFENGTYHIMLNLGSTALPYEPYGWKVPFENHGENLCNVSSGNTLTYASSYNNFLIDDNTRTITITGNVLVGFPVPVEPNTTYTVYASSTKYGLIRVREYSDKPSEWVGTEFIQQTINERCGYAYNFTTTAQTKWIVVAFYFDEDQSGAVVSNIMLTPGTTPEPYSPYLNETIPVYLGEVPTVRRMKKLVLDGTENFESASSSAFRVNITDARGFSTTAIAPVYCTHYTAQVYNDVYNGSAYGISVRGGSTESTRGFAISKGDIAGVSDFKSYLASEYANGTPVTIWYVLANEQTAIVNEPLCKISTYADELTTIQVHGLSAPLYGIGDYKDTLNLSTGVVTRKVIKTTIFGNDSIVGYEIVSGVAIVKKLVSGLKNTPQGYTQEMISTHFESARLESSLSAGKIFNKAWSYYNLVFGFDPAVITSLEDARDYFNAQIAVGHPVEVWYVLNTPETETVTVPTGMTGEIEGYLTQVSTPTPTNRSVPKWNGVEETGGTYAVTVYTPPDIPTTTGQNTLTVETEKIHGLTNPLCGIGDYKDVLNLSTGVITRKVKKLVLTGEESDWSTYTVQDSSYCAFLQLQNFMGAATSAEYAMLICTHYDRTTQNNIYNGTRKTACGGRTNQGLLIRDENITSASDFKSFLAAQYQAGTPVTIWYVLETPETETITVPYGLECSVEGYLTQSTTPTPSSPITPDSNGVLESGGTYAVEVSLVPSNLIVKGHIKELT